MLFEKFFRTIKDALPFAAPARDLDALAGLDPSHIYVENVRSVLGVSYKAAVAICEAAVRQGIFQQWLEVTCPDGTVAAAALNESRLPETVRCLQKGADGFDEELEMPTQSLSKTTFYRLVDGDAGQHSRTA